MQCVVVNPVARTRKEKLQIHVASAAYFLTGEWPILDNLPEDSAEILLRTVGRAIHDSNLRVKMITDYEYKKTIECAANELT